MYYHWKVLLMGLILDLTNAGMYPSLVLMGLTDPHRLLLDNNMTLSMPGSMALSGILS
jgi:hypothetical protein